ncbi:MAG: hypothetical protein RL685_3901 [Pseudomonadota bacterium]|jgi:hypothetical protein
MLEVSLEVSKPLHVVSLKGAFSSAAVVLLALSTAACRSGDVDKGVAGVASPAAGGGAAASGATPKNKRSPPIAPLAPEPWHIPVGISLPILPGEGVGPIRFGASLETIQRLIAEPCEEKRQDSPRVTACRYSAQAIEFFLTDGALSSARIHRLGRPFLKEPKPDFGIYNGRFQSGASLGMLQPAVQELLGKPRAVRAVTDPGAFNTVELHDYDGFVLEYDKSQSGQIVLGGIQLSSPKAAKSGKAPAKAR